MLISGRATRYEVALTRVLNETELDIHLFMSINDESCLYYDKMKDALRDKLKGLRFEKFEIPENFHNKNPNTIMPKNVLSMLYNDNMAFTMASSYSDYDVYVKSRADLYTPSLPNFAPRKNTIHSIIPHVQSSAFLYDKVNNKLSSDRKPWVSDAFVYGDYDSMKKYCSAYENCISTNLSLDGDYPVHFERTITDNCHARGLDIDFFHLPYQLDKNRRMFDTDPDSRSPIPGTLSPSDITESKEIDIAFSPWEDKK